jgi:formate-nitrite transporter family protein
LPLSARAFLNIERGFIDWHPFRSAGLNAAGNHKGSSDSEYKTVARMTNATKQLDSPRESGPVTTQAEQKQVEERVAVGVNVVYEAVRREGEVELRRPAAALAWSALAAGLSMGFSFLAEALLSAHLPQATWTPLITKVGYSVGFLIVVLGRQQLFTENTLTVVLPVLLHKDWNVFLRVGRLWGVVLSANLVGTYFFALALAHATIFDQHVTASLAAIGAGEAHVTFAMAFLRAIFAGWLIALMVWLLPGAESARVGIIIIITYLVGLGGFNHIVAGSTTMFYLVVTHALSWHFYIFGFFLPTLLGNILGGVSLVAALGHAQVVGGKS